MKRILFTLLPGFAMLPFVHQAFSQKVGSTSMQFLKVMPCARAAAMGDAYSVLGSGAEAVFWNPAGLAQIQGNEVSLTYVSWIFDARQAAFSFATSLGSVGAAGLQVQYVDFGEIEEALWRTPFKENVDYPGLTGRTFRPYAYLVGLTYAKELTEKFSLGLSAKYAHESLYNGETSGAMIGTGVGDSADVNTWANGLMFDFGIRYNTGFRTIRLGASVQNFGADVTYALESNPIPLSLRVGIAADLVGANALLESSEESRLAVALDLFQPNDYAQQAHVGAEYEFAGAVAFRAGYKINYDADGFTAGLGVKQTLGGIRLFVDYSYGSLAYSLGNVQRISIGAGF